MNNLRDLLEERLGRSSYDWAWRQLEEDGHVGDAEALKDRGDDAVGHLKDRYAEIIDQLWSEHRLLTPRPDHAPPGVAAAARADALREIYAAWAHNDSSVNYFRHSVLKRRDGAAWKAYLAKQGPNPGYELLDEDEVKEWVKEQYDAMSASHRGEDRIEALIREMKPGDADPTVVLQFTAGASVTPLTVVKKSVLGELAEIAGKLSNTYRWHPADAATFVLTGRAPEVVIISTGIELRMGLGGSSATRITLVIDPTLPVSQVADIYSQLRAQLHGRTARRALSLKQLRLATHVGPHLNFSITNPGQVRRRGRPPKPSARNLVSNVLPVGGHTWEGLRRSWNEFHGNHVEDGRSWLYPSSANFIRDARHAVEHVLDPGWMPIRRPDARKVEQIEDEADEA